MRCAAYLSTDLFQVVLDECFLECLVAFYVGYGFGKVVPVSSGSRNKGVQVTVFFGLNLYIIVLVAVTSVSTDRV